MAGRPRQREGSCSSTRAQELLAGLPTTGTLQPCPLPALSAHGHRHLWGSGSMSQTSTGSLPAVGPKPAQAVVVLVPCHPCTAGESAQTCALCSGLGQDLAVPPTSLLRAFWTHHRSQGCPPLPQTLPAPVPPQPQWDRASPAESRGALSVPRAQCWGGQGRAARVGTPCSPAVCVPSTLP